RDLILYATRLSVDQIEMVPAITFRGPDQVTTGVRITTTATLSQAAVCADIIREVVAGVAVHEEALRHFIDHGTHRARRRVDLQHAVDHVAALIVLERVRAVVLAPNRARDRIRILE